MGEERDDRERRFNEIAEHIPGDLGVLLYLAGWAKEVLDALATAEARLQEQAKEMDDLVVESDRRISAVEAREKEALRSLEAAQKFANASPAAELLREFAGLEAERDAALAHVEALKVAGEGLAASLHNCFPHENSVHHQQHDTARHAALAAWRKAVDASALTVDDLPVQLKAGESRWKAVDASAGGGADTPTGSSFLPPVSPDDSQADPPAELLWPLCKCGYPVPHYAIDHEGNRYEVATIIGPCSAEDADALATAILELPEAKTVGAGGVSVSTFNDSSDRIAGVPIKDTLAPLPEEYRR